jgi:hypothetical protein
MTYQVTTISVRPSTSVSFFIYPKQFINKWEFQGVAKTSLSFSEDTLTQTRVTLWSTKEIYEEFLAEQAAVFADRDAYNTTHNITVNTTTTTI